MIRARIAIVFGLAAITAVVATAPHPRPAVAQTPRFSDRLTVREREILVDLPEELQKKPLKPGDFQVLVDGRPREVTRAEPVSSAGEPPWTIVVYIDRVLASPGTVFYSSLALSQRAAELTRLGTVEVVVADSDPRQALSSTREARALNRTLDDLAAAARVDRDRKDLHPAPPAEPDAERVRRQLDKLLAFLNARPPSGPHAVLLVVDGPELPDEQLAGLDRGSPAAPQTVAAALQRTARLLAAYGWVAIPVLLRKEEAGSQASMQSDAETLRQSSAGSRHGSLPPTISFAPPKATSLAFRGVIDLMFSPRTAPLRALARPTAGTVIGFEAQLDEVLAALQRRWRLWLIEPDAPDGLLHSLTVTLPGRRETVRAPEWLGSSTSKEIAPAPGAAQPAARSSAEASSTARRASPSTWGEKGFCRQMGDSRPLSESCSSL